MTATRLREIAARLRDLDTSYDEVMLMLDNYADELEDIAIAMEQ